MAKPTPFEIKIPDAELDDLRRRLAATRWPEAELVDDWEQGIPLSYLQDVCSYWQEKYDWRAREAALNRFPQFKLPVQGLDIHFVHVKSPEKNALPLIMTHGWPGSIVEFQKVIGPLSDPKAHGGDAADAFDVICPSLPGYGWSSAPAKPMHPKEIADLWAKLMTEVFGIEKFSAQGGDWGSIITSWLGHRHPRPSA